MALPSTEPRTGSARPGGVDVASRPLLEGRWTSLAPVDDTEIPALRRMASAPEVAATYRYRGATPSIEAFAADLWRGAALQLSVRSRSSGRLVGLVGVFDPSFRDRHAHLGVLFDASVHRAGWPLEAVGLLIEHAFASLDIAKLYAHVADATFDAVGSAVRTVADVEVRLEGHEYRDGGWRDSFILAIHRDRWLDSHNRSRARLLQHLSPAKPVSAT